MIVKEEIMSKRICVTCGS